MSSILLPGTAPDDLVPWCARCDMPVERYQLDLVNESGDIGVHASCCGQTSATRVPLSMYLQMKATGARLYVIVRKGSQAGLRMRARQNLRVVS